jgi:hypothetical protein
MRTVQRCALPHVQVPVLSKEDLTNGRDAALEKAIEILAKQ